MEGTAAPENQYLKICGQFFESCRKVEESISNLLKIKLELLDSLLTRRSFQKVYDAGVEYSEEKTILKELLNQATGFCKGKHCYVLMLLIYYYSRIENDIKMV